MRGIVMLLAVLAAAPAAAQVQSRPTDPPIVNAANDAWYQQGEPVQFAGELYYRGGAAVFFNGNTMVRTGHYNGVPLYVDTTVEPYSVVLVPIGRGLLQPYERPRRGSLAGTTGSRLSSFPVAVVPQVNPMAAAAVSPTSLPAPESTVVPTQSSAAPAVTAREVNREGSPRSEVVGTAGILQTGPPAAQPIVSLRRPENNDGVWVSFGGERWISAGPAVPLSAADFIQVGERAGFPVYARRELKEEKIYIPTGTGLIAPYRLKK
jgi:hypothetical protein